MPAIVAAHRGHALLDGPDHPLAPNGLRAAAAAEVEARARRQPLAVVGSGWVVQQARELAHLLQAHSPQPPGQAGPAEMITRVVKPDRSC